MNRPTVLHITTTDISLDWLLKPQLIAFGEMGWRVITASADGPHVASLVDVGIEHHALPSFTRSVDWQSDMRAVRELAQLIRVVRPDILHTHNPKPGILGRVFGKAAGARAVVNTVHGLYAMPSDPVAKRAAVYGTERFAASFSDLELVQSAEDLRLLANVGVPSHRLIHLGNGIDLDRFTPTRKNRIDAAALRAQLGFAADAVVIGIVGRMVRQKGYGEFIDAVALLREMQPEKAIEFVTVGPDESSIRDGLRPEDFMQLEQLGVRVLGRRDDMECIYQMLDLAVLPSYREGFPRAAMEANAMAVPVIASDIRGCREVVRHEVNGLLVPVRQAEPLAEAMHRLSHDDVLRRRLQGVCRQVAVSRFDQQRVIDLTAAAYRRVVGVRDATDRYTSSSLSTARLPSKRSAAARAA